MKISVGIDKSQLKLLKKTNFEAALTKIGKKAGRDALRAMSAEAKRQVRERKNIKARTAGKGLKPKASGGSHLSDLSWRVVVSDAPIPLQEYPTKQTSQGVVASINRGAKKTLIKSAFFATMPKHGFGVFLRKGRERAPTQRLFSSTVADSLSGKPSDLVLHRGTEVFRTSFARLLALESK